MFAFYRLSFSLSYTRQTTYTVTERCISSLLLWLRFFLLRIWHRLSRRNTVNVEVSMLPEVLVVVDVKPDELPG